MEVEVIAATIAATAAVASATIPAWLNRGDVKKIKANVGDTNGQGTVAQMGEAILLWSQQHQRDDLAFQEEVRERWAKDE